MLFAKQSKRRTTDGAWRRLQACTPNKLTEKLILGAPFLEQYVFQFDYPNKRMRLITRDSINLKKQKNVKSQRDFKTGDPIVRASLNDEKDIWLLLDTGNTGGVLIERKIANGRGWLKKYPTEMIGSRGATETGQIERFNLPKFEIGGFELGNVIVSVPAKGKTLEIFKREGKVGSHLGQSRTKSKGILGYDVLRHFIVTIDYQGGHVHLEAPTPEEEQPKENAAQSEEEPARAPPY